MLHCDAVRSIEVDAATLQLDADRNDTDTSRLPELNSQRSLAIIRHSEPDNITRLATKLTAYERY